MATVRFGSPHAEVDAIVRGTPNHGHHRYERGDADWSHAPDTATIEERLVVRVATE